MEPYKTVAESNKKPRVSCVIRLVCVLTGLLFDSCSSRSYRILPTALDSATFFS